jgi:biofilm PGA synthesis N-glycosyltransferase PgaC
MTSDPIQNLLIAIGMFCYGYPFVMAWYWIVGGILFYLAVERRMPPQDLPPHLDRPPPISVLVPCFNEGETAEETLQAAAACDYPEFEVIAINDGSRDDTGRVLDRLACEIPRLRVVHLAANQGKATALNVGALLAKHEILVGIDGDALLDPEALWWVASSLNRAGIGGLAGHPMIRNRTTILGRLQVGEFASVIGLIRRAQGIYGRLFTASGVICAFRKRALDEAGWWSPETMTEDIDITWRVQLAGWRVVFQPNAVVWILMPETLHGLWRQRLRWAEGGIQMMLRFFGPMVTLRRPSLLPTYVNFVLSVAWAYMIVLSLALALWGTVLGPAHPLRTATPLIPDWWALTLTLTYLAQALISGLLEQRYERGALGSLFWTIWYPVAFWTIGALTTFVALPRVLLRPKSDRITWTSPDRGLR